MENSNTNDSGHDAPIFTATPATGMDTTPSSPMGLEDAIRWGIKYCETATIRRGEQVMGWTHHGYTGRQRSSVSPAHGMSREDLRAIMWVDAKLSAEF